MNFQLQKRAARASARWKTIVSFPIAQMERIERVVTELLIVDPRLSFRIVQDDGKQLPVACCLNGQWRKT